MSDLKYWLGFSLVPEIGPKRLLQLLDWFGSLSTAWAANDPQLRQAGLEQQPRENFLRIRQRLDLDGEMLKVKQAGAWLLTWADDNYPALLRTVANAPALLYVRGTLTADDTLALTIVGTRKATTYGRDAAYDLARQLAKQGITIISGLAYGIDAAAHKGVLDGGGRTLAVMGCGVDVMYPRDHRELALKIIDNGAIISEFPIGMRPDSRNFPRRNRIMSGLALGVLVIEAPENSGALITAELAAEQGREVFAIPGNIYNPMSRGTNRLIQDGAKLVMQVSDILDELNIAHSIRQTRTTTEQLVPANETEAQLLQHLSMDPLHIDELARRCQMPIEAVSSTLTILELKGLARSVGHMQYSLVHLL